MLHYFNVMSKPKNYFLAFNVTLKLKICLMNTMVSSVLLGVGWCWDCWCIYIGLWSLHPSWATRVLRALVLPALLLPLSGTDFGLPCTWWTITKSNGWMIWCMQENYTNYISSLIVDKKKWWISSPGYKPKLVGSLCEAKPNWVMWAEFPLPWVVSHHRQVLFRHLWTRVGLVLHLSWFSSWSFSPALEPVPPSPVSIETIEC